MGELGSDHLTTSLARMERLGGDFARWAQHLRQHPEERGLNVPVAPVRELGAYYLVSVGAGPASYAHRAELKALHLRWDPTAREWSGVVLGSDIPSLENLGLMVSVRSGSVAPPSLPKGPSAPGRGPVPREARGGSAPRRPRDHARTSVEAYLPKGERESLGRLSRFTLLDITSGLADDTREDDQRARAAVEAERRGRVAAALAALEAHAVARAQVFHDQTRCVMFCARFGVTPADICPHVEDLSARVVAPGTPRDGMCAWCHTWHGWTRPADVADVQEVLATPADWMSEVRAREVAVLPGSDSSWD